MSRNFLINRVGLTTIIGVALIGLHAASAAAPVFTSPSGMCQYYQDRWEQGLFHVVPGKSGECLVQVGDNNSGIGYIRGYYSGGKFCMASTGAYFNNAGIKDSVQCIAVSGTSSTAPRQLEKLPSWEDWKNLIPDLLNEPNFKWYAAGAVAIAGVAMISGYIRRRHSKKS